MKNNLSLILVLITTVLHYSCQPKERNAEQDSTQDTIINTDSISDNMLIKEIDGEREPTENEIREYGKILKVEDGAYPMFVVTIEFPERKMKADFNLNIEAISLDVADLNSLVGEYASFYYTSELENMLYDIHYKGKTLFGENAPESLSDLKTFSGTLNGAEAVTVGDLPDEIIITDDKGNTKVFKEYITQEIVDVNGKEVKVFYTVRGVETITNIIPSEN